MEREVDKENSNGIMEKFSKDSGIKVKRMALGFGNPQRGTFIKDSGRIIGKTAKVTMFITEDRNIEVFLSNF
jgi:hypothetical protein